jgi:hypothetical protein
VFRAMIIKRYPSFLLLVRNEYSLFASNFTGDGGLGRNRHKNGQKTKNMKSDKPPPPRGWGWGRERALNRAGIAGKGRHDTVRLRLRAPAVEK